MIYHGHIRNGVAVLDPPVTLPDGTPVKVEIEPVAPGFWHDRTVEELAREQGVGPIDRVDGLAIDWPEEDSIDEFLALLREVRR